MTSFNTISVKIVTYSFVLYALSGANYSEAFVKYLSKISHIVQIFYLKSLEVLIQHCIRTILLYAPNMSDSRFKIAVDRPARGSSSGFLFPALKSSAHG